MLNPHQLPTVLLVYLQQQQIIHHTNRLSCLPTILLLFTQLHRNTMINQCHDYQLEYTNHYQTGTKEHALKYICPWTYCDKHQCDIDDNVDKQRIVMKGSMKTHPIIIVKYPA